jgi:hypothetical protein
LANDAPLRFGKHGEWSAASNSVVFSKEAFDLERIVIDAPNGVIAPDTYFFNLHGKTLRFAFDGPYNPGEKSPDENTRQIERKVLASFELF